MTTLTDLLTHVWNDSNLKSIMGIEFPLIQAPMAGITTPELVAAVSNAGGLGSLSAGYMTPQAIQEAIKHIRKLTKHPFSVNLFVPEQHHAALDKTASMVKKINQICTELKVVIDPPQPPYCPSFNEQMEIIMEENIPIVSFVFGIPEPQWIKKLKSHNTIIIGTATTLLEAKKWQHCGADIIVAQGSEAGGHRGTFLEDAYDALTGSFSLIPQLVENLDVPVVAAGGIMNARHILAALTLGAVGMQMGTAFLTCKEAGSHPEYKKALLNSEYDNTVLTKAFSGKLARGVRNKFINEMRDSENECLAYPIQNAITSPMRLAAAKQNNLNFMSLWAGQSAFLSQDKDAEELIKDIVEEVNAWLQIAP